MTDDKLEPQPNRPASPRRLSTSSPPRMAKPIQGGLREVAPGPPPTRASEPEPAPESSEVMPDPVLDLSVDEPEDEPATSLSEQEASPEAEPEPEPEPEVAPKPKPKPEPAAERAPEAVRSDADTDLPSTVKETLRVMDDGWRAFHARATRFPAERMDEHLTEHGWTRKQMLAHVAAWHDHTAERMIKFVNTGKPAEFDQDVDRFNAMVARRAIGKTAGEIMNDTEATFNRLRRQVQRLTDAQLLERDRWAAWVIRSNTYGHYDEHSRDVYVPEPPPGSGRR